MQDRCPSYSKYKAIYEPRCSCKACWFKYFWEHRGLVAAVKSALDSVKEGEQQVVKVKGKKFMKMFRIFKKEMLTP